MTGKFMQLPGIVAYDVLLLARRGCKERCDWSTTSQACGTTVASRPTALTLKLELERAMNAVTDHYAQLLAPIYLWMAGGPRKALDLGTADLSTLGLGTSRNTVAIDLGSGFGMHAIPLARLGYAVTAIDSSAILLNDRLALTDTNHCAVADRAV